MEGRRKDVPDADQLKVLPEQSRDVPGSVVGEETGPRLSAFHAARGDYQTAVGQLDKLLAIDSTVVEAHRRHSAYLRLMGSELGPELSGNFEALYRDVGVAH